MSGSSSDGNGDEQGIGGGNNSARIPQLPAELWEKIVSELYTIDQKGAHRYITVNHPFYQTITRKIYRIVTLTKHNWARVVYDGERAQAQGDTGGLIEREAIAQPQMNDITRKGKLLRMTEELEIAGFPDSNGQGQPPVIDLTSLSHIPMVRLAMHRWHNVHNLQLGKKPLITPCLLRPSRVVFDCLSWPLARGMSPLRALADILHFGGETRVALLIAPTLLETAWPIHIFDKGLICHDLAYHQTLGHLDFVIFHLIHMAPDSPNPKGAVFSTFSFAIKGHDPVALSRWSPRPKYSLIISESKYGSSAQRILGSVADLVTVETYSAGVGKGVIRNHTL